MEDTAIIAAEKPQNGLAGLKHWRHDLLAGLVVSMVSVPFSLGIAVASGAPPICGLISAIIAGLVLPFLGGSYVTISGPAAGRAPALLPGVPLLGKGDLAAGYPLLLVAICLTGLVQLVLAFFKATRFSAIFPSSVVEGMLASIGLLIIAKLDFNSTNTSPCRDMTYVVFPDRRKSLATKNLRRLVPRIGRNSLLGNRLR